MTLDPGAVVQAALRAGADTAEAVLADRAALSVSVRLGKLEEVEREESRDLGLRVFVGRRQAAVSTSALGADAVQRLVERAVAMARLAPEDPYVGLAPAERLWRGGPADLDLYDESGALGGDAGESGRGRRRRGAGDSGGGELRRGVGVVVELAVATGDQRRLRRAASGERVQRVGVGHRAGCETAWSGRATGARRGIRRTCRIPESIGVEAGKRAVARLGGRKIESRTAAVIFENRTATAVLGPLIGAISGPAVARGVSFPQRQAGRAAVRAGDRPDRGSVRRGGSARRCSTTRAWSRPSAS
jgi:PmbA protein